MSVPCPKCRRQLDPAGDVTVDDQAETTTIYQCDTCTVEVNMFGTNRTMALTFAVDADGRYFDPSSGEEIPVN